jgi:Dolichyl-phosphate-mannose-protein mannosyltransferase
VSIQTSPEEVQTQPVPEPRPAEKKRRWPVEATATAWLIVAGGAFFRIRAWLHWRSLWLDEIYVAHSIVTRGFWRLLSQPLDFWQAAPPGFLVLERTCVDLFGAGERALRLPSLLAGVAAVPLFYLLARRVLSLRGVLIAVILFACMSPLVYYSQEVKQYSFDLAASTAILLSAVALWQEPQSRRNLLVYGAVGVAAILFSHPAAFSLAGTLLVLLIARTKRLGIFLLLIGAAWGGLEWANFRLFLMPLMRGPIHEALVRDWTNLGGFPPRGPNEAAPWIWQSLVHVIRGYSTMYISAGELGMFAAIIGAASLLMSERRVLGLLVLSPLPLALAAAFVRRYPFADRLALHAVPVLTLLIAAGVDQIWASQGFKRGAVGMLAALILLGGPFSHSLYEARYPSGREETKQLYQWIRRNWRTGDVLMLSHMAARSFDYYAPRTEMVGLEQLWQAPPDPSEAGLESSLQGETAEPWLVHAFAAGAPNLPPLDGYVFLQGDHAKNPAAYLDEIDGLFKPDPARLWPPVKRVWVVFAHDWDEHLDQLCLPELDRKAELRISHTEPGAAVYLYELTGSSSDSQRQ